MGEDRDRGLYEKYHISKVDGTPIDPGATYLVLRLDAGWAVKACRAAAKTFAFELWKIAPKLAQDVLDSIHIMEREP